MEAGAVLLESGSWNRQIWQELFRMREQSLFCDIHLMGNDGKAIPAHGCVVAAASTYLRSALSQMDHKDRTNGVIVQMPNISSQILESILSFIYVGNFCLSANDFVELSNAADFLGLKDLKQMCSVLNNKYIMASSQSGTPTQAKLLQLTQKNRELEENVNSLRRQLYQAQRVPKQSGTNTVQISSMPEVQDQQVIISGVGDEMSLETDGHNDAIVYTMDEDVSVNQTNPANSSQQVIIKEEIRDSQQNELEFVAEATNEESMEESEVQGETIEYFDAAVSGDLQILVKNEEIDETTEIQENSDATEAALANESGFLMNSNGMYLCQYCGKEFPKPSFLKVHMAKHSDDKPYKCEICGLRFKYKHSVKLHMPRHGDKNFHCNFCTKSFFTKREITVHERSHTGVRPFECSFCGKAFSQHSNLLTHKRSNHNLQFMGGQRDFECPMCGRRFVTRDQLSKHEVTHSRILSCHRCPSVFKFRKELKKHMLESHGEEMSPDRKYSRSQKFECTVCQETFRTATDFKKHNNSMHVSPEQGRKIYNATADEQSAAETLLHIEDINEISGLSTISVAASPSQPVTGISTTNTPASPSQLASGPSVAASPSQAAGDDASLTHSTGTPALSGKKRTMRTIYLCPVCGLEFDSTAEFRKHLPQHSKS